MCILKKSNILSIWSYIDSGHKVIFQGGHIFGQVVSESVEDFKISLAKKYK